ncbi:MAG: DUF1934 domain-containing protein [Clostridia bacterium]|nr:DUF1934 domain-containing protein [Clostridia bacterium]
MKDELPVLIQVSTLTPEEDDTPFGETVVGTCLTGGPETLLTYTELIPCDGSADIEEQVRISIRGDRVIISRLGDIQSAMVFEAGKRCETEYRTPEGAFTLSVHALRLKIKTGPEGLIDTDYLMTMGGQDVGLRRLRITWAPTAC